jgi:3-hydroxyisobutyryl-CoA hydrolase
MANSAQTNIEQLVKPLPNDDPDDVIFSSSYGLRVMELNRPKKLNSLNGSMARKIIARMQVGGGSFSSTEK